MEDVQKQFSTIKAETGGGGFRMISVHKKGIGRRKVDLLDEFGQKLFYFMDIFNVKAIDFCYCFPELNQPNLRKASLL